ncbi:hypothetical protein BDW74DRAFT_157324 [Aspergillus multicolor]|uniref:uncharacterized protein n=1 Tax=Aspergillus multicolor TaxID=41759 RepID=UPI003CCCF278
MSTVSTVKEILTVWLPSRDLTTASMPKLRSTGLLWSKLSGLPALATGLELVSSFVSFLICIFVGLTERLANPGNFRRRDLSL